MNDTLMYFLKVNIAIALFYLFYRLFFAGDTFWKARRYYLLLSILVSFVYPFLSIENWLQKQEPVQQIIVNYVGLPELVVTPYREPSLFTIENILLGSYLLIVLVLLVRFMIQLISIFRIRLAGKPENIQGVDVITVSKEIAPFSFFNSIYINPALHNPQETCQILLHEQTHVRQLHSLDVIISEALTMIFWFNPASWLLKREIRQNLEFLADNKVLESGFDSRTYQYHLLQLTYQTPDLKLTNKFNVSPLKKRITMMNKQKSAKARMLKYSLIVPLALALVLTSNAQTVVENAKKALDSKTATNEKTTVKQVKKIIVKSKTTVKEPNTAVDQKSGKADIAASAKESNPKYEKVYLINPDKQASERKVNEVVVVGYGKQEKQPTPPVGPVYSVVDKMPEFPGGENELIKFLARNVRYPAVAQENNIQGRVIASFVVNAVGKVESPRILRSLGAILDNEALRVINTLPDFVPGEQNGKKVAVWYTLPITFTLDGGKTDPNIGIRADLNKISGNPLIVVDGKYGDGITMSSVSIENVQSISVLKDKSATEKYGEKAKDGVIEITMKKK